MRLASILALLLVPAFAHAQPAEHVRVVSWNVWGVPYVTPHLDARPRQG